MRSPKEQNERQLETPSNIPPFTFRELVDGIVLGDGQIDRKGLLHIDQSVVRAGWLDQVQGQLQQLGGDAKILLIAPRIRILEGRELHSKEGRHLYTPAYVEMQAERARWYPDGTKIVPRDLRLTPLVVAHWFAGDGTYNTNGTLTFCTNSFSADEVDFLIERLATDLNILGAKRTKTPRPGQYTLGIYRANEAAKLANLIRPLLPDCCQYKLQHIRPTRKPHLLPEQVIEIRRRGVEGKTAADLAVEFNVSATTVRNILAGRSHQKVGNVT